MAEVSVSAEQRRVGTAGSTGLFAALLLWVGPLLLAALALLGAINHWGWPVSLGSAVNAGLLGVLFPVSLLALASVFPALLIRRDGLSWRESLAACGGGLLGGVLLVGAWAKIFNPASFAESIAAEGLDFLLPAFLVAVAALGIEIVLGSALLLGLRQRWVLGSSAALVAFFLFLTGRAYRRDLQGIVVEDTSCGCFGNLLERTPAQAFWQDLFLLLPALLLCFLAVGSQGSSRKRMTIVAAVGVVGMAFAWRAPHLPLDDFATRLHPGAEISELCSGSAESRLCLSSLAPELLSGRHVVVLTTLTEDSFVAAVQELNTFAVSSAASGASPGLVVLSSATPEEKQIFFWTHGPSFEIAEAPQSVLRPLYRTLPRSFLVSDGRVEQTFRGLPPLADL